MARDHRDTAGHKDTCYSSDTAPQRRGRSDEGLRTAVFAAALSQAAGVRYTGARPTRWETSPQGAGKGLQGLGVHSQPSPELPQIQQDGWLRPLGACSVLQPGLPVQPHVRKHFATKAHNERLALATHI